MLVRASYRRGRDNISLQNKFKESMKYGICGRTKSQLIRILNVKVAIRRLFYSDLMSELTVPLY